VYCDILWHAGRLVFELHRMRCCSVDGSCGDTSIKWREEMHIFTRRGSACPYSSRLGLSAGLGVCIRIPGEFSVRSPEI
jgi:hypothetical protein